MEKGWRLQRYNRKDYTELVDFPVEIVGRDGVVRRYTFEDSIRLYRRRITFAPLRYRDPDLVHAEVDHCRSRIDQLRRSYFHRFGWGVPEGQPSPIETFGAIAGEVAAFLCRVLRVDGRPEIRFEPVPNDVAPEDLAAFASAGVSTWYVVPRGHETGMILAVHRFSQPENALDVDGEDSSVPDAAAVVALVRAAGLGDAPALGAPDDAREAFFSTLKQLEKAPRIDGEEERLVAFHHTVDCGFVLSARGADFEALRIGVEDDDDEPATVESTPWDEALDAIRRGQYADSLSRCRQIVAEQPWHRNAYIAGSVLALHLEQPFVGEDFALVGSKYFPTDASMAYYLGLARVRQGRRVEALGPLRASVGESPTLGCARLLLAVELLQVRRFGEARRVLADRGTGPDGRRPDDRRAESSMVRLEQWLFWRMIMVWTGYGSAALGLLATALAGWFGLVPVMLGLVMAATGMYAFGRELVRIEQWQRFEDVSQGLRRLRKVVPDDRMIS